MKKPILWWVKTYLLLQAQYLTGAAGVANPYTTIERKDVGVTLKVVPHIGEDGTVRLEVEQEVSDVKASKGQAQDLVN